MYHCFDIPHRFSSYLIPIPTPTSLHNSGYTTSHTFPADHSTNSNTSTSTDTTNNTSNNTSYTTNTTNTSNTISTPLTYDDAFPIQGFPIQGFPIQGSEVDIGDEVGISMPFCGVI
jgi:hypothetical protein